MKNYQLKSPSTSSKAFRGVRWPHAPATNFQRKILAFFGVAFVPEITRLTAQVIVDRIFSNNESAERWAKYLFLTGDKWDDSPSPMPFSEDELQKVILPEGRLMRVLSYIQKRGVSLHPDTEQLLLDAQAKRKAEFEEELERRQRENQIAEEFKDPASVWKAFWNLGEGGVAGWVEGWLKAASLGDAQAQLLVGMAYSEGFGVAKDLVEGYKWYLLARDQGDLSEAAKMKLRKIERDLTPAESAEAQRLAREFKPVKSAP